MRDRLAEIRDFLPLIAEEQRDQLAEALDIAHVAAHDLLTVLDQDGGFGILENDIVLRIALGEFFPDFLVEIVGGVLGLPIAERHAQVVQDGSVGPDAVLLRRQKFVLGHEDEIGAAGAGLQQVLEGFGNDAFGDGAGEFFQAVDFVEIILNQNLVHESRSRRRELIGGARGGQCGAATKNFRAAGGAVLPRSV
ncbi:hypothetical protein [Rhodoblastus sp.]|uniref:hypothetical protein n=1 Tax=Rhodoblastus sp. TaxID=1962975 RepID=UPI0035B3018E